MAVALVGGPSADPSDGSFRDRAATLLRTRGERATGARLDVLDVLAEVDGHLAVAEIHRRVARSRPATNLSTVYRTVDRLVELGLVHGSRHGDETAYGLALRRHGHLRCVRCGATASFDLERADLSARLRQATGYDVTDVDARGVCPTCAAPG